MHLFALTGSTGPARRVAPGWLRSRLPCLSMPLALPLCPRRYVNFSEQRDGLYRRKEVRRRGLGFNVLRA